MTVMLKLPWQGRVREPIEGATYRLLSLRVLQARALSKGFHLSNIDAGAFGQRGTDVLKSLRSCFDLVKSAGTLLESN